MKEKEKLNHPYFKSIEHYINYCNKIISTNNINHSFFSKNNLLILSKSLSHSNIFEKVGIEPPYQTILNLLKDYKENDSTLHLITEFENDFQVIVKIFQNKISINDCDDYKTKYPIFSKKEIISDNSKIFTEEFFEFINRLMSKSGVYFLYDEDKNLIYIGKSNDLYSRIQSSIRVRKASNVSIILTNNEADTNILEVYYICKEKPILNTDLFTLFSPSFSLDHSYEMSNTIKIFKDEEK